MRYSAFHRFVIFDCKKGFRENIVKWGVAILLFVFLSDITIKNCLIFHEEMGYIGYLTYLFQGMPEYIRSETSIFQLPVCWLLYYVYLFFLIGFYPISDLYSCGMKSLLSSGSRKKWLLSKYLWVAFNVIAYFIILLITLYCCSVSRGHIDTGNEAMLVVFGVDMGTLTMTDIIVVWILLPILTAITIAFIQFTICICVNSVAGYITSIVILAISVYWMKTLLPGNYLMIIRSNVLRTDGMDIKYGIILDSVLMVFAIIIGNCCFTKKDIYQKG